MSNDQKNIVSIVMAGCIALHLGAALWIVRAAFIVLGF